MLRDKMIQKVEYGQMGQNSMRDEVACEQRTNNSVW